MQNQSSQAHPAPAPDRVREAATLCAELEESDQALARLLASMTPVQDWQPEPEEWSFRYLAAHLATVEEACHLQRVRAIASGDTPHIANYCDRGVDFRADDLPDSLQRRQATRRKLIDLVTRLSAQQLTYIGIHEKLGALSLLDVLREIVEQDQGHLRHVRRLISIYYEENRSLPAARAGAYNGQTENGMAPLYTNHKHGAM